MNRYKTLRPNRGNLIGGSMRVIDAWIGYTDGKPYVYVNDHGQAEWCVFTNRDDARKAFGDVRKVRLCIAELPARVVP
jgi:hypothetical protein